MIENDIGLLPDFKRNLLNILDKYRDLGEIVHPNGTISIGKIPNKNKWFLIHLYAGLKQDGILKLEAQTNFKFPTTLNTFYSKFNGVSLFGAGQFGISGLRFASRNDMPNYQPSPYPPRHLDESYNYINKPKDVVFFGGYFGTYQFYITQKNIVYACKRGDATPIEQWDNIEVMILDVAERLSHWFDENAQPIDPIVNEQPVLFEK